MGPCVRLIRALVAQPELTEERRRAAWVAFKNKVKNEGWELWERDAWFDAETRQSNNAAQESNCVSGSNCLTMSPVRVKFEDDWTLTGSATITYADGTTEVAQVVHRHFVNPVPGSNRFETTILTSTKNIDLSCWYGVDSRQNEWGATGRAITTATDGTQKLASVVIPPLPIAA